MISQRISPFSARIELGADVEYQVQSWPVWQSLEYLRYMRPVVVVVCLIYWRRQSRRRRRWVVFTPLYPTPPQTPSRGGGGPQDYAVTRVCTSAMVLRPKYLL